MHKKINISLRCILDLKGFLDVGIPSGDNAMEFRFGANCNLPVDTSNVNHLQSNASFFRRNGNSRLSGNSINGTVLHSTNLAGGIQMFLCLCGEFCEILRVAFQNSHVYASLKV